VGGPGDGEIFRIPQVILLGSQFTSRICAKIPRPKVVNLYYLNGTIEFKNLKMIIFCDDGLFYTESGSVWEGFTSNKDVDRSRVFE
jgi:hypothetical protein